MFTGRSDLRCATLTGFPVLQVRAADLVEVLQAALGGFHVAELGIDVERFQSTAPGTRSPGWLKVVFAALVAVDVALIAWLAQNFQGSENVSVILALVAVVFTTGAIVGVNHAAYRRISELENL